MDSSVTVIITVDHCIAFLISIVVTQPMNFLLQDGNEVKIFCQRTNTILCRLVTFGCVPSPALTIAMGLCGFSQLFLTLECERACDAGQ